MLNIKLHDAETNKVIIRELTDIELTQLDKDIQEAQTRRDELQEKANIKAQLLNKLGITEDQARLLLG